MLNDKICKLREKLNESIINGEDYSIIYQLSIELDELIAQYYEILIKNSWLKYFYSIFSTEISLLNKSGLFFKRNLLHSFPNFIFTFLSTLFKSIW